ncbi:uncharacterized protein LOC113769926 [Coffea eugenioides]|uniref:uncharacterized protein LOC113769926 n=1 Tax=Coffea eugenioides TaxID=49369 RepID=UPI000F60623D|nr:uncharacterized protein LOC113769926 [Coffea eugenioides]
MHTLRTSDDFEHKSNRNQRAFLSVHVLPVADRTVDVVQENISDKTKESSAGKEVAGLVDGVFTDPDSDSGSPIETSNPFAQLTDIGDVEDIVPRRLSSPSQSAPARSPRGIDGESVQPVIFRQRSAGSVQE